MRAGRIVQEQEESGDGLLAVAAGLSRAANGRQAFEVLASFLFSHGFADATLTVEPGQAVSQWGETRWSTLAQDRLAALDSLGFGAQNPVHRLVRRSLDPFVWTTDRWPGEPDDARCGVMPQLGTLGIAAGISGAVWGRVGRLAVVDAFAAPEFVLGLSLWDKEAFQLAAAMTLRAIERVSPEMGGVATGGSVTGGAGLTRREAEILELASQGMTMRRIAGRLGIVEATVKFHLKSVRVKLNARNTPEAIARFAALGRPISGEQVQLGSWTHMPTGLPL